MKTVARFRMPVAVSLGMICLCLTAWKVYACHFEAGDPPQITGPDVLGITKDTTVTLEHDFKDMDLLHN